MQATLAAAAVPARPVAQANTRPEPGLCRVPIARPARTQQRLRPRLSLPALFATWAHMRLKGQNSACCVRPTLRFWIHLVLLMIACAMPATVAAAAPARRVA